MGGPASRSVNSVCPRFHLIERRMVRRVALVLALALASCFAPRGPARDWSPPPLTLIPGTEIQDTPEARAVLAMLDRYRVAMKEADVGTLLALASPSYHDDAGTESTDDDLDFDGLRQALAMRLEVRIVDLQMHYLELTHDGPNLRVVVEETFVLEEPHTGRTDRVELLLERTTGGYGYRFLSGI